MIIRPDKIRGGGRRGGGGLLSLGSGQKVP